MRTTEDTQDMEPTIMLPAVVDLAAANTLLATLRERLAAGRDCRLDASQVETLMLPGIQVVLAATRSSEKVEVVDPSLSFCGAFQDAGLTWIRAAGPPPVQDQVENAAPAQVPEQVTAPAECQASDQSPEPVQNVDPPPDPIMAAPELAPSAPIELPAVTAKRILTIDDSRTMRDMLRMTLVDAGYVVLQAVDGLDGLDVLKKERVDVVITDINMPKMDGYGVIRHLRADSGYDDTPILVLSTENDQKTKDIGRDAGATGWLVKPFDPDQLVEIVKQVSP
jgi:two-component system chemotaxis response regulator CheY